VERDELVEHRDHAAAGQRRPHLDRERLAVTLFEDVQRAEAAAVVAARKGASLMKSTAHVPLRATGASSGCNGRRGRRRFARRGRLSRSARYGRVHAVDPLRVPGVADEPEAAEALPAAPARVRGGDRGQRLDHRRIALQAVLRRRVERSVRRPREAGDPAGAHD
jgi:hypothetical protein